MSRVRCAIYTRKSSEEGLEQDFNSLHAQREACGAYVLSQASEGWSEVSKTYDDGGLSGGTLDRPGLQQLLVDVTAGEIDIIVVYKVDRLTRSLLDFAKLVETFDKAGVSFVSVTQSFNTTTSMGRLTLNMLLSFAQFEREVTAERIRDKIAASKAKGMWMGGTPPLGYRPDGRSLTIVEEHAELIRNLFRRYLELCNVRLLAESLQAEGIRTPVRERTTGRGKQFGGAVFSRGQLYKILSNPVYRGEIQHRGKVYAGKHAAIIDPELWAEVQRVLAGNTQGARGPRNAVETSLLVGLIVDPTGEPMVAAHATKGKTRYRYYVSRDLQNGEGRSKDKGIRIPAREIEAVVVREVAALFSNPIAVAAQAGLEVGPSMLVPITAKCQAITSALQERSPAIARELVQQVRVGDRKIEIQLSLARVQGAIGGEPAGEAQASLILDIAYRLTRTGRAIRLVQGNGSMAQANRDPALVKLFIKARRWWAVLERGEFDIASLAARDGVSRSYISRVIRLAFLSPPVVEAILDGCQHGAIDASALCATDSIPASWDAQARRFLPTP
jgi:site-specific DNA recombinase